MSKGMVWGLRFLAFWAWLMSASASFAIGVALYEPEIRGAVGYCVLTLLMSGVAVVAVAWQFRATQAEEK